jgi:hypothetical protein
VAKVIRRKPAESVQTEFKNWMNSLSWIQIFENSWKFRKKKYYKKLEQILRDLVKKLFQISIVWYTKI